MINRYQGNSGRYTRIEEQRHMQREAQPPYEQPVTHPNPAPAPVQRQGGQRQRANIVQNRQSGIFDKLSRLLPSGIGNISQLETEDIILLLILYLMYRESGDSELLMIMGAMFLL